MTKLDLDTVVSSLPEIDFAIKSPKYSDWDCYLFGTGLEGIVLNPVEGNVPCWFWRFMQRLCFGNKWVHRK